MKKKKISCFDPPTVRKLNKEKYFVLKSISQNEEKIKSLQQFNNAKEKLVTTHNSVS